MRGEGAASMAIFRVARLKRPANLIVEGILFVRGVVGKRVGGPRAGGIRESPDRHLIGTSVAASGIQPTLNYTRRDVYIWSCVACVADIYVL
jgi:hypothetical protein